MQVKWMQDPESNFLYDFYIITVNMFSRGLNICVVSELTFIILDKSLPDTPSVYPTGGAMAGDVNLFISRERFHSRCALAPM